MEMLCLALHKINSGESSEIGVALMIPGCGANRATVFTVCLVGRLWVAFDKGPWLGLGY